MELHGGVVCFIIVGLERNVRYVLRTLPVKNIVGDWVKNELLDYLKVSQENNLSVLGVVCDAHSTNVLVYKNLIKEFGQSYGDVFIMLNAGLILENKGMHVL